MTMFTVLGARGYIGSRLVALLRSQGYEVWTPERDDVQIMTRALGHVVYCIGLTGNFRTRPFDTVQAHAGLLAQVLEGAHFDSLLYLSSTRVYMGAERTDENAPLTVLPGDSSYLYNLSKLTGESLCHASGRRHVRVARLSNVVGPGMNSASGNLIADLLHQAAKGHIKLFSDPLSSKDYVHIDDVINALVNIAMHGRECVYNVASGVNTSHAQWLEWLVEKTGCTTEILPNGPLQTFPVIDVRRLHQEWPKIISKIIFDTDLNLN